MSETMSSSGGPKRVVRSDYWQTVLCPTATDILGARIPDQPDERIPGYAGIHYRENRVVRRSPASGAANYRTGAGSDTRMCSNQQKSACTDLLKRLGLGRMSFSTNLSSALRPRRALALLWQAAMLLEHRIEILGARIPEELIERILGYVCTDDLEGESRDDRWRKKGLGRCALVNRFWATRCQALIFRSIKLQSAQDVRQLLKFIKRPDDKVAQYIQEIQLPGPYNWGQHNVTPWLHLLPLLYPKLPFCTTPGRICLSRLPHGKRTLRSIHWNIPRSLPTHFTGLQELALWDIEFASLSDLVHLLDELRDLRVLSCRQVAWAEAPPLTRLRPNRPRLKPLQVVDLRDIVHVDQYISWLFSVYRAPPDLIQLIPTDTILSKVHRFIQPELAEHCRLDVHRDNVCTSKCISFCSQMDATCLRSIIPYRFPVQLRKADHIMANY